MRLAIDAMGNDRGPQPIVEGVKSFLASHQDAAVVLVGPEDRLKQVAAEAGLVLGDRVTIEPASQVVEMHEKVGALREKRDSSIMRLVATVKEGRADAMVALGNTAAAAGAATMGLRTLQGVHRPGIAVPMPTRVAGRPCVTIDMGANTIPKPAHLVDYAIMASTYAERVLHIPTPRVGLLNVGEERGKGNPMLREAYDLLQQLPLNFIGNIEGGNIFDGSCDVCVCDGFVGNVVLKASEGLGTAVLEILTAAVEKSIIYKAGAWLARPALRHLKSRMNYETYGGAPLLGINGICIVGHGRSSANAVFNALRVARECVQVQLNETISERVTQLTEMTSATQPADALSAEG